MQYRILKDTDLQLSNICLGTASFGEKISKEEAFEILDEYVRRGGNFIDTANIYCRWVPGLENCSEKILGEWLRSRGQTLSAAYLISSPFQVFPVTGARNTEQLEDIVRADEIYIEPERFRLNGYDSDKRSENIIR